MLKLPPLQPHLTGTNSDGVHKSSYKLSSTEALQRAPPETTLGSPGIPGLNKRSWPEQSQVITDKLQEAKSRSISTIARVRLQEALHECSVITGISTDEKPHRLRTAVCCKLLEELSTLAGPYADMLQILCKELVKSTYSDCYALDGSKDRMDQLPYYCVVEKLEKQKACLLAEQYSFRQQLTEQLSNMNGLSVEIQVYGGALQLTLSGALQGAEARNAEQTAMLLAAESRERQAATDAEAARQAIEEARADIVKLSSDAISSKSNMQATISSLQQENQEASDAQAVVAQSLRTKGEEISQLHSLLQGMVKQSEVADLEAELREMQVRVPDLQRTVQEQAEKLKALGDRTPRPEWHAQRGRLPACDQHMVPMSRKSSKSTAVIAGKVVSRLSHYASQLNEVSSDRDELQRMMLSDPVEWRMPSESPAIEHDARQAVVDALGCRGAVPRMLRATGQIRVLILSNEELSRTMWDLLQFLPEQFSTLHGALFDMWLSRGCPARAIVPKGYCLTLSLQAHRYGDPIAAVLYDALQGKLHAHVVQRMASIVQGVGGLFSQMLSLHMGDAETPGCFACEDVTILLQRMFPSMADAIGQLLEAQMGSLTAGQSVHIQDVAVAGSDCTESHWCQRQPESAARAMVNQQPLDSLQIPEPWHGVAIGQRHDTVSTADGCMYTSGDQEVDGLHGPQGCEDKHKSRREDDHVGRRSENAVALLTPDPDSVDAYQPRTPQQDDCTQAMRTNLALQLLSHHANSLIRLRDALEAELKGFEDSSGSVYTAVLALLQEHMPHVEAHACASLWLTVYMRTGSAATATAEMLATGPLQCQGDFDVASARTWLQGLQERGVGHSSCAALPQVA